MMENGELVTKDAYDIVTKQVTELVNQVERTNKRNADFSRTLDLVRKLIMIGTVVVIAMLLIVTWVPGSSFDVPHKEFVGMLVVIMVAFIAALWIAQSNPLILLLLLFMGDAVFMFALGFTVCGIRKLG